MKNVWFITEHQATSPVRTNFSFWAQHLTAAGVGVRWLTTGFSVLTRFGKNKRYFAKPYNEWVRSESDPNLCSFTWRPLIHPANLGSKFLNSVSSPIFAAYPRILPQNVAQEMSGADVFIIENGAASMLAPIARRRSPTAKIVYLVNDRVETIGYHPIIKKYEPQALAAADVLVGVAEALLDDYPQFHRKLYIPHGLEKEAFSSHHQNPYPQRKNAVSIGDMLFDDRVFLTLARQFPDWTFHLFGTYATLSTKLPNVIEYGRKPFQELVPYMEHADIGIAPYSPGRGADYLSQSSLKMIQYTYCRLPILAPDFAKGSRAHVCSYNPYDLSDIESAFRKAISYDRSSIDPSGNAKLFLRRINVLRCLLKFRVGHATDGHGIA